MEKSNHLSAERKKLDYEFGGRQFVLTCQSEKDQYEYKQEQDRLKKDEQIKYIEKLKLGSLMDEKFKRSTFENFEITKDNENYFKIAKIYAENFEIMKEKKHGLLIYGNPGTGKTYLSYCIANYLLSEGKKVIACSTLTIIRKIKECSSFGSDKLEAFYNNLKKVDVLILDDLGSEDKNEWVNSRIYEIVDLIYRANKILIITTNLEPDTALKSKLTNKDGVPRIYDRVNECCRRIKMKCNSRRIVEADRKQEEFNRLFKDAINK